MNTYCVKCRKDTENIDPKIVRTKNNRLVMQSKCSVCGIKKSRFLKVAKGLLSNLGIRTPLSKIPLLNIVLRCIKMNEIVNKLLLVGEKFMSEMHLKQPVFTYSACGSFTKIKEKIEKFMETGNKNFIYKNKVDKACFQHEVAFGKLKDLVKRRQSDKFLKNKAFTITSNPKYDGYQRGVASMVYNFFCKKPKGKGISASLANKFANEPNYQLANELHKAIIRKF